MRRIHISAVLILLILMGCTSDKADTQQADNQNTGDTPPAKVGSTEPVGVFEVYHTERDTIDNVDSPVVWHGPEGEHWLLATAKETDVVVVYDAATGRNLRRIGASGAGRGQFKRPNGISVTGNMMLVVERDNHRVQVMSLPECRHLGFIGADVLLRPYGLWVQKRDNDEFALYVTDNYETPDENIPPDSALNERVRFWRFSIDGSGIRSNYMGSFGDTSGPGVLRKVESIYGDPLSGNLLIADEDSSQCAIKVYRMDGRFTGTVMGKDVFKSEPEGIALYSCPDGSGFWFTTDQHEEHNTFHIFDRKSLKHLAAYVCVGTSNTDGIALSQHTFGPFPKGAFFAVHDDGSVSATSLEEIGIAVGLEFSCSPPIAAH